MDNLGINGVNNKSIYGDSGKIEDGSSRTRIHSERFLGLSPILLENDSTDQHVQHIEISIVSPYSVDTPSSGNSRE